MRRVFLTWVSGTAAALAGTNPASAQTTPSGLSDLIGARAAGGESQLQARGYTWFKTDTGTDRKWSYWWNNQRNQCISVVTYDGRYASIILTLPADCGRTSSAGTPSGDVPQVIVGRNGEGEVIFSSNNCVAYFDAWGRRTKNLPACSAGQVYHADDAMARYRREQGMEGPAADHDGGGFPGYGQATIKLTCFGEGHRPNVRTMPVLHWDKREHEFDSDYVSIMSRKEFDTMVQIDIHGNTGYIWLPKSLVPAIHSGGDHGWWELDNLMVTGRKITGRYKLNSLNRPRVTIDGGRSRIRIQGQRNFKGTCEPSGG